MTVQFYSFAEVVAPSASTKLGQLADAYETKLELNAISSNISSNYYTKDETDGVVSSYLPLSGGTMYGELRVESSGLRGQVPIPVPPAIGDTKYGNV